MPQIREQIAMVHLPPSKTLKYLFHVRKTQKALCFQSAFLHTLSVISVSAGRACGLRGKAGAVRASEAKEVARTFRRGRKRYEKALPARLLRCGDL